MKSELSYEECMSFIHGAKRFSDNPGLKRTKEILRALGSPQDSLKIVHVAGTNGKGSVTAMISSVLKEAGYSVGMYTSPYLEEFEERIQINNVNISKTRLAYYAGLVKYAVKKASEKGLGYPNEFEIITCIMFKYFADEKVDYAVVEVGLGGRLDATNVIKPVLSVITAISYDHMNVLGNTLGEIAEEKAGIIKNGIPVVSSAQKKEVIDALIKNAESKVAEISFVNNNSFTVIEAKREDMCQLVEVKTDKANYKILLNLLGTYQVSNCALAVNALEKLIDSGVEISMDNMLIGLNKTRWIGRMEVLSRNPLIVIDGAHNIDGIKKLKESTSKYFLYKKLILILGILADKDTNMMLDEISSIADYIIFTLPHSLRAEDPYNLYEKTYDKSRCFVIESYEEALKKAELLANDCDMILCAGSLYMIGDMRKVILNDKEIRERVEIH